MTNKYSKVYGPAGTSYSFLDNKALFEPHLENHLSVENPNPELQYKWTIHNQGNSAEDMHFSGQEISVMLKDVGFYEIELKVLQNGALAEQLSFGAACKYVRREIRKLFEDDREELLDAMQVMWEVGDEDGKALFGEGYVSMFTLHKYHLIMAGDQACDHMHDGYGFLSHHSYLGYIFEQSLQAMNPKLALPYWDYVYDIEEWAGAPDGARWDFTRGELFTAAFLGATDPETHTVADGRWAETKVPSLVEDAEHYRGEERVPHNALGHLRSPWSVNPDRRLIRSQTVCGGLPRNQWDSASRCPSLQELFARDDWASFGKYLMYEPHGRVHVLLGGAVDCAAEFDALAPLFEEHDRSEKLELLRAMAYAAHKNLYRGQYLDCSGAGGCACPEEEALLSAVNGTSADEFLLKALPGFGLEAVLDPALKAPLVRALCNSRLADGDSLQSSASWDPAFWLVHAAAERMVAAKVHRGGGGGLFGGEWPDPPYFQPYEEYCTGHAADDKVLFGMHPLLDLSSGEKTQPTVKEWAELVGPGGAELPYVYDTLDWDYCQDYGVHDVLGQDDDELL